MARLLRSRAFPVVALLAIGMLAVLGLGVVRADPTPDLPAVTPEQLVAGALQATAERTPVSGTVETHIDLGLPQLPAGVVTGGLGPLDALLSDQTFRVWRSTDGVRVGQILPTAERVLVVSHTDVWAWDSDRFTAWHVAVPTSVPTPEPPSLGDLTEVVVRVLAAVAPYADVTVGQPVVVAGRDAYTLELAPTDETTLVGRIEIAIDAETRVPLRLRVIPKGSLEPAIEAGFTSVDFAPIDPTGFTFTPPPGAEVEQLDVGSHATDAAPPPPNAMPEIRTSGEGFGLILAVRVPAGLVPSEARVMLPYAGPLGSVDLVARGDHSWVVAGAVPPDALAELEAQLP